MFMMKKTTLSLVLLLGVAALACRGAAAQTPATNAAAPLKPVKLSDLFEDSVIAKGKGFEVKRSQLEEELTRFKARAAAQNQRISPEQMPMAEQNLLEDLIRLELLRTKATPADKETARKMADQKMAEARTELGSDERMEHQLSAMGLTRQELLSKWTDAATAETVLKRDLNVNITDQDARKFYDENPSKFEQPEMVRASHILLMTKDPKTGMELSKAQQDAKRKQMEDILKRARAGEDFAKLAKEYSEDPGLKDNGGEYTFPRGQMVREFEVAAFSLNTNQISDIVTTQFGYHIIKLSEKMPAKKIELEKVLNRVKDSLTQQAITKQFPDYYKKLRADANVQILDERLKPREKPADLPGGPLIAPAPK